MANLKATLIFDAAQFANDAKKAVTSLNAQFSKVQFDGKKIAAEVEKVAKNIKTPKLPLEVDPKSIAGIKNQIALLTQKKQVVIGADLTAVNKEIKKAKDALKELDTQGGKTKSFFAGNFLGNIQALTVAGAGLAIAGVLKDAAVAGIKFEKTLASVSALTGVTGVGLTDLSDRAIEIARTFGTEASDQLLVFKTILSKLGPDIAKTPAALDSLARSAATLSAATGDTAEASIGALTDSLLQFQVPLDDASFAAAKAAEFMNVLAAGAKEGAAEVPQIAEAIKVAGVAASGANVSFVETNAALQALAAGGKQGAEAGTALRNVLGTLSKGEFIPKEAEEGLKRAGVNLAVLSDTTLPFTDRLRELKKIQADAALTSKLFGTENAAAASILIRSADAQDILAKKITGTNAAVEQAGINQATIAAKMDKLGALFSARMLQLFQDVQGFVVTVVDQITAIANAIERIPVIFNTVKAAITGFFSGIFEVFNQIATEISNFSLGSIGKIVGIITNSLTTIGASTSAAVAGAVQQSGAAAAPEIAKMSDDMARQVGAGIDKINAQVKSKKLKNIDAIKDEFKAFKDSLGADASNEAKNILFKAENDAIALFKKLNKDGSGGDKPKGDKKGDAAKKKREDDLKSLAVFIAAQNLLRESAEEQELTAATNLFQEKITLAEKLGQSTVELKRLEGLELNRIANKYIAADIKRAKDLEDDKIKLAKEAADKKKQIADEAAKSEIDAYASIASNIQGLAAEGTAIAKIAGIASVGISTYVAAAAALTLPPTGAGPILGIPLAASIVINGLLTASKIAGIPAFHEGTDYFMPPGGAREGYALLERGERVVAAKDNTSGNGGDLVKEIRELRGQLASGITTNGNLRVETTVRTRTKGTDTVALIKKVQYQKMLGVLG